MKSNSKVNAYRYPHKATARSFTFRAFSAVYASRANEPPIPYGDNGRYRLTSNVKLPITTVYCQESFVNQAPGEAQLPVPALAEVNAYLSPHGQRT